MELRFFKCRYGDGISGKAKVKRWLNECISLATLQETLSFLSFCHRPRLSYNPTEDTEQELLATARKLDIGKCQGFGTGDEWLIDTMDRQELIEAIESDQWLRTKHPLYHVLPPCYGTQCRMPISVARHMFGTRTSAVSIDIAIKRDVSSGTTSRLFEEFARMVFEREAQSSPSLLYKTSKQYVFPVATLRTLFG